MQGLGEQADRLYVIMKGRVEIIINVDGVGAKKVREMGELEFFGENGLFEEGSSRGATVQSAGAVGKCTLLTLTRLGSLWSSCRVHCRTSTRAVSA